MDDFSSRLTAARQRAGYSSGNAAAERFGMNPSTYRAHEAGSREPNYQTLEMYSRAFKVSIDWLIKGSSETFDEQTVSTAAETIAAAIGPEQLAGIEPAGLGRLVVAACKTLTKHPKATEVVKDMVVSLDDYRVEGRL